MREREKEGLMNAERSRLSRMEIKCVKKGEKQKEEIL